MFYYRIFDDKEDLNFFKSSLKYEKIAALMSEFEKTKDEYRNSEFINFLKERDKEAEIIDVTNIYY
ncbi:MAG: hypothetical protein WC644_00440 [Ignavibacteria bacterium]